MTDSKMLKISILSLSMLTIISGAAVSPALGGIKSAFLGTESILIQMILTVPAIFIVLVGLFYNQLAKRLDTKKLVELGLILYVIGGCCAGLSTSIYMMLVMRAIMGVGVGILMPLSTSLLIKYFASSGNNSIMGLSFAVNNLGAIISLVLTGILASISWHLSFLIYAMGIFSAIAIYIYLPKEKIEVNASSKLFEKDIAISCLPYILGVFLTMTIFYIFITNFSLINETESLYPKSMNGVLMAMQATGAMVIGLLYGKFVKKVGTRTVAIIGPAFMAIGYLMLYYFQDVLIVIPSMVMMGMGFGMTMPMLNSNAASSVSVEKVTLAMGFMSVGVYTGQFFSPLVVNSISNLVAAGDIYAPYAVGAGLSVLLLILVNLTRKKVKVDGNKN